MINFNGFGTAKIFDEIAGPVIVFDASKIIFYNSKASLICGAKKWGDVFFPDVVQDRLAQFFQAGTLEENQAFSLTHTINRDKVFIEWKFRDISNNNNHRICLAIGDQREKIIKEPVLLDAESNNESILNDKRSEIDRYRVLASN